MRRHFSPQPAKTDTTSLRAQPLIGAVALSMLLLSSCSDNDSRTPTATGGTAGEGGASGDAGVGGSSGTGDAAAGSGGAGAPAIDECALGTHTCDTNATCTDTAASFMCACNAGFGGDGTSCTRTVNHPADGFAAIQDAVDAAGCAGTVLLAAGTYNERVFLSCGVHLIGAGVDQTILHDTGLEALQGGLVNLGGAPFESSRFTEGYELAHMTLRAGAEQPSLLGASVAWTRNINLHDLKIQGFTVGIGIAVSTSSTVENVHVQGPDSPPSDPFSGPAVSKCIQIVEFGLFLDELPHMTGHVVKTSLLESCGVGVDLQNTTASSVEHNTIKAQLLGISIFGASRAAIHHNVIAHSTFEGAPYSAAGIDPSNANDSEIYDNTICDNSIGIHFSYDETPDAFGFLPSRNNNIHHNTFGLNGDDVILSSPDVGPGNEVFGNVADDAIACP